MATAGFKVVPIRLSETCQNISGQVKCPFMVIPWTSPFLLQLETRLTEITRRDSWHVPGSHRSRRCLSCWHAARCSWSRSLLLFHPSVRAPFLGDNTRSASLGRCFCASSDRLLGSMFVVFLGGRLGPVGACAFHTQPAK